MKLTFIINPVPASRPRVTRWAVFYPEKYTQFRTDMAKLLMGKRTLLDQPLRIDVSFFMPIPKSASKKKTAELDGTYCVSNVDLDNLEKALYDSMNGVIYLDDKQIVEHTTRKKWCIGQGRIEVTIDRI